MFSVVRLPRFLFQKRLVFLVRSAFALRGHKSARRLVVVPRRRGARQCHLPAAPGRARQAQGLAARMDRALVGRAMQMRRVWGRNRHSVTARATDGFPWPGGRYVFVRLRRPFSWMRVMGTALRTSWGVDPLPPPSLLLRAHLLPPYTGQGSPSRIVNTNHANKNTL